MTEEQIKHMVDRFLGWRLPENFNPDGGVKFEREVNGGPRPAAWWPTGTNVLDAIQARAMVAHMIDGLPEQTPNIAVSELRRFQRHVLLRTFDENGQVQPEFLAASEHLDAVLAEIDVRPATESSTEKSS